MRVMPDRDRGLRLELEAGEPEVLVGAVRSCLEGLDDADWDAIVMDSRDHAQAVLDALGSQPDLAAGGTGELVMSGAAIHLLCRLAILGTGSAGPDPDAPRSWEAVPLADQVAKDAFVILQGLSQEDDLGSFWVGVPAPRVAAALPAAPAPLREVPVVLSFDERVDRRLAARGLTRVDVLAYMEGCPVLMGARGRTPDRVDESAAPVPIYHRCDGVWCWSSETEAYLERYGMPLPADLLDRIARLRRAPDVGEEVRRRAEVQLRPPGVGPSGPPQRKDAAAEGSGQPGGTSPTPP